MLSPRLTNCKECANIPDLLRKIDCKLAELGNNMYNNVVFMLNRPIAVSQISELLVYKRLLTFRYCDTHYASGCPEVSTEDIASKVIRLTAGCVSLCNEPTVCEITTCAIIPCPNPTTTTTSTSSTSTTTTTSTTATPTTTTTTTITPDCRIEGCFDVIASTTTTTSTSSTSSTTTTSTTVVPFDCAEPFNLSSPEAFPNVITGNGTKVLSNGVLLTTSYTPNMFNQPPIYVAGVPGTIEICNGAYLTAQSGGQGTLSMRGGSTIVMDFNPPINAIAFVTQGYGSSQNPSAQETVVITSTDVIVATELTACGDYATTQISQNEINLTGSQALYPTYSSGVTAISPISGGISQLQITINPPADELAGISFDFYVCPGSSPITTTTTSTSSTTTTTTTAACVDCIPGDVTIGTQTWSKCNLNVDTYLNGDPIPEVTDPSAWVGLTTGAWCYYSNDSANEPTYGKLYNWFAVNDPRGLAPAGYHIPTNDELITLINYIDPASSGGATVPNNAGGPLKEVQFCHWQAPNTAATDSSGFTGLPGGSRETLSGVFAGINEFGTWWSSTEDIVGPDAFAFSLYNNQTWAYRNDWNQNHGYSVRLIKDTGTTTTTSTTTVAPTTTTTTTVAPTTTTTTTLAPLVGCLEFDYLTLIVISDWILDPPTSSLYARAAFNTGPTTNTTSYTSWSQVPNTNYDVVFNIGGVDYTAVYQFINVGTGGVTVPYGKFSINSVNFLSMSTFQFSKIDANGNDLSSILSTFDHTTGDGYKVTAYGDCTTPTTTTTTTSAKSYDIDWQVVGQGNGFKEAKLELFKNGASVVTQVITNGTPSVQGLFASSNGDVISAKLSTKNLTTEQTQVQNSFSLVGAGGLQELDTDILQPPAGGVINSLVTNFSTEYTQPGINSGPLLLFKVNQEQIASSEITMSLTNNGANFNFEIEDNDQPGDPVVFSIPTNSPIWNGIYDYDFLVGREYTVTFPYSNNEPGGVSTELVISGGGITPFSDQVDNPSGSVNTITHTFTVLNATSIVIDAYQY